MVLFSRERKYLFKENLERVLPSPFSRFVAEINLMSQLTNSGHTLRV